MARPVDARRELLAESRQRGKRRRRRFSVVLLVAILVLVGTGLALLQLSALQIKVVTIKGNKAVATEEIKKIVTAELEGSTAFIIPNNMSLLLDKQAIGQALVDQFSDIKKVSLDVEGLSELVVTVSEREQKVLWCESSTPDSTTTSERCWYTDTTGVVFAPAPNFSDSVVLKLSGLVKSGDDLVGKRILPETEFVQLLKTVDTLPQVIQAAGISPTRPKRVLLDQYGDVRLVIAGGRTASSSASGDWEVLFNRDQLLSDLINNLATVLNAPEFKADIGTVSTLAYIDLRFGKKVFYKFKQ